MAMILEDTFTGGDGTLLGAHTGETGAVWASNGSFGSGNGTADEFILKANRVRRVNFDDPFGFPGGTALAYSTASTSLDAVQHFDAAFDVTFEAGAVTSILGLYFNAQDTVGSPELMFELYQDGTFSVPGTGTFPVTITPDAVHQVRALRRGDNMVYMVDGVMVVAVPGVAPVGKLGFSMFDFSADSKVSIDNLTLSSVDGVVYYDEFDGVGNLSGYTSDSGHSYLAFDGSPLTSVHRESGFLTSDSAGSTRRTLVDYGVAGGSPVLEFLALKTASASTNAWSVNLALQTPGSTALADPRFGVSMNYLGGVTELRVSDGVSTTLDINELPGNPSVFTGTMVYVKCYYDAGSNEVVVDLNGVETYRALSGISSFTDWRPFLAVLPSDLDNTGVWMSMLTLAVPVAPGSFWTNRVRTQEVV